MRNPDFRSDAFNRPAPMFTTEEGLPVHLVGLYKGCAGFLIANGPSLKSLDLPLLSSPGIVTVGLNNGPSVVRPNFHVCGDQPARFVKSTWLDPRITKVVPQSSYGAQLWDDEQWQPLTLNGREICVRDCPNVIGIHRNDKFAPEQWLHETSFGWGNSGTNGGCRTVFLLALKLMYVIGVRKLFIVGCDLNMEAGDSSGYAFAQARCKGAARMNNKNYQKINRRCSLLKPYFDQAQYLVYNATPDSGLTAFPYIPFEDAMRIATENIGKPRTEDMYLSLDHPAKIGKSKAEFEASNEKDQKKYLRRDREWFDRMTMYWETKQKHLIPKRFLKKFPGFPKCEYKLIFPR